MQIRNIRVIRVPFFKIEMTYRVHRHATAQAFLDRAEAWLMQAEAEHNLILGLARRLTESIDGYDPPIYLASVEDEDGVVGCAYRTPPYKFGLTRMPEEALLVDDAAEVYASLPAAVGPMPETQRFAAHSLNKASFTGTLKAIFSSVLRISMV